MRGEKAAKTLFSFTEKRAQMTGDVAWTPVGCRAQQAAH